MVITGWNLAERGATVLAETAFRRTARRNLYAESTDFQLRYPIALPKGRVLVDECGMVLSLPSPYDDS